LLFKIIISSIFLFKINKYLFSQLKNVTDFKTHYKFWKRKMWDYDIDRGIWFFFIVFTENFYAEVEKNEDLIQLINCFNTEWEF